MLMGHIAHLRILCAKFGYNYPCSSEGEDSKMLPTYFSYLVFSLLGKDMALHQKKFKSPSPKDAFCQIFEFGTGVLKKMIFQCCQIECNFSISLLLPIGQGPGPSFEQNWIPLVLEMIFKCCHPLDLRMICIKFGWNCASNFG